MSLFIHPARTSAAPAENAQTPRETCWHPVPVRKRDGAGTVVHTEECRAVEKQEDDDCEYTTREACANGLLRQTMELEANFQCVLCMEVKNTKLQFHDAFGQSDAHGCCGSCMQDCFRRMRRVQCPVCRKEPINPDDVKNVSGAHVRALEMVQHMKKSFAVKRDALPVFDDDVREDIDRCNFASIRVWLLRGGPKTSDFCAHAARANNALFLAWASEQGFPPVVAVNETQTDIDFFGHVLSKGKQSINITWDRRPDILVPEIFRSKLLQFTNLKYLALRNCHMPILYENMFFGLSRLRSLGLKDMRIETVQDGAFNGLGRLKILNLQYNSISTLPPQVFHICVYLESLDLEGNNLARVDQQTFRLPMLQTLHMEDNHITQLDDFSFPPTLRTLSLAGNPITQIGARTFSGLTQLENLHISNLSQNPLVSVDEHAFDDLINLSWITIDDWQQDLLPLHVRAHDGLDIFHNHNYD